LLSSAICDDIELESPFAQATMKNRPLLLFLASVIAVLAAVWLALTSYWQHRRFDFNDAPKLIAAMQAYGQNCVAERKPLPPSVSLQELVNAGYLTTADVRAFDGMDVTISLRATHPQDELMRVRMRDGTVALLLADGSVSNMPPTNSVGAP
jgi:hypothetical protein